MHFRCAFGVIRTEKRNDTMYSSGVYHLNRSGTVESIENNNIVVRLDKLNEQDEDFKNVDTLQLDCRNCGYELENLKEGKKLYFTISHIMQTFDHLKSRISM